MGPRCTSYIAECDTSADIIISEKEYDRNRWQGVAPELFEYMDSGWIFYAKLLDHGGMVLHSSAIELDGRAYLFSGPSGMGKSTHTRLWQQLFPTAKVFNDDKPALRKIDGTWYAYGTPWCGKDGININVRVPLAGICFLRRGSENKMRRLSPIEGAAAIMSQTLHRFKNPHGLDKLTVIMNELLRDIPIFELACLPDSSAAMLSHRTMINAVEED